MRDTPPVLWTPDEARVERATITRYARWLAETRGVETSGYHELWRWSVSDIEAFWASIWEFFDVQASRAVRARARVARDAGRRVVPGRAPQLRGARLPGARPAAVAVTHASELRPLVETTWGELHEATRRFAAALRAVGCRPGRPRRRLPAEHRRGGRRVPRVRQPRRDLVELLARLRASGASSTGSPRSSRASCSRSTATATAAATTTGSTSCGRCSRRCPRSSGRSCSATSTRSRRSPASGAPRAGTTSSRRAATSRSRSRRCRSTTRSGCSTAPAPPACPRRSCTGTAGSCSSC